VDVTDVSDTDVFHDDAVLRYSYFYWNLRYVI